VRVAQVMQADHRQRIGAERGPPAGDVAGELAGHVLGVAVGTLDIAENERVITGERQVQQSAGLAVRPQHRHRFRVQVDHPGLA